MEEKLNELREKNLFRKFRTISGSCSSTVKYKNKEFIMLASNNYFGLNTHPKVIEAAKRALETYGAGNTSSRLIANLDIHEKLERELAEYKKCSSSLVFACGYSTNLGVISSIAGKNDAILSDELNHASIIDGCRLSRADVKIYRHRSVKDLEKKLSGLKNGHDKILVVTDSIFSMDGDFAPISEILELKKKHRFIFMVDDAHATGVIDTNSGEIDIRMGTLSKALASQGGFVAGSKTLIDYLKNTSRSFMFSTGLSPPNAAAALAALKIIKGDKSLKDNLLYNSNYLRHKLSKIGFRVSGEFQIIPLLVGDAKKAMLFQKMLEKERIFVAAIRPPAVPTARLRISVMATHTKEQLDAALESFEKIGAKLGLV